MLDAHQPNAQVRASFSAEASRSDQVAPVLRAAGLGHRYGRREVLEDLSLHVLPGELLRLLGPNGSGKSTALALLAGLLPLRQGSIELYGQRTSAAQWSYRASLGVVFQAPSIDSNLTALENLELAGQLHGMGATERRQRANELLESHGLMARAKEPCKQLSGGMRRRVDLARALMHAPAVLLLDEPSTGLDEPSYRRLWQEIDADRRARGMCVLLATHRHDEAARCDRLMILDKGRAAVEGEPATLIDQVGEDLVRVRGTDPERLLEELQGAFAAPSPTQLDFDEAAARGELRGSAKPWSSIWIDNGDVVMSCRQGHELVVLVAQRVPRGRISGIHLVRPTLADAYMRLVGSSLLEGDQEQGA